MADYLNLFYSGFHLSDRSQLLKTLTFLWLFPVAFDAHQANLDTASLCLAHTSPLTHITGNIIADLFISTLHSLVLNWSTLCLLGGTQQCPKTFLIFVTGWEMWLRIRVLPNVLQGTRQPPQQRILQPTMSMVLWLRNSGFPLGCELLRDADHILLAPVTLVYEQHLLNGWINEIEN